MAENERKHIITTTLNDDECEMLDLLLDEFDTTGEDDERL